MTAELRDLIKSPTPSVADTAQGGAIHRSSSNIMTFTQNQREEVRDLNDVAGSVAANEGMHQRTYVMTYQDKTGTLAHGAHPGTYNGQDAYNDMLIAGIRGYFTMQRTDKYRECEVASTLSARQYKSATDLICTQLQTIKGGTHGTERR